MSSSAATAAAIQYPAVRRDEDFVENLHGVEVRDPYRWLEDPHSEETKAFVDAQNIISKKFIESYPSREPFKKRMTELFNFEKYSTPFVYGNRIFYFHNTGLQSQDVLYVMDGPDAEPRVLLDLNTFSEDGTVSMNTFSISEDGEWLAYGVSSGGSDWVTVRVRSVAPGQVEDHPDGQIEWVKFSYLSWTHDHKGFFYSVRQSPRISPEKIAINGGSNGGLLVGAAVTQRPDLYGAAVADVGVLDMLRFHKFTIGHFWMSDYGCPDKEEDFQYLYKYSPYHNIRIAPGQRFPSVMVTTGDHDDRVVPLHSHKFIAALQHALENAGTQGSDIRHGPAIARIETRAGHGAGKPTMMIIDETCDRFAFIAKALDLTYHE
ncbi:prolyl oligopeptidase [Fonticula alba]|uniref:Prolyl endopeptidase n=1 Tax=Fonticula alba TaxID=691883 RepID=A0A058Z3T6_FONAL|nr:prolyl oligopeptidase [Fonticula alba]KCV68568.1 prolyl oligopeptidase [Fonticula alba]|eukprot:XP_009497000.1 prolyl oligopeptidase [Fonticula alba]